MFVISCSFLERMRYVNKRHYCCNGICRFRFWWHDFNDWSSMLLSMSRPEPQDIAPQLDKKLARHFKNLEQKPPGLKHQGPLKLPSPSRKISKNAKTVVTTAEYAEVWQSRNVAVLHVKMKTYAGPEIISKLQAVKRSWNKTSIYEFGK